MNYSGGGAAEDKTASFKFKTSPHSRLNPVNTSVRSLRRNPSTLSRDEFGEMSGEESSDELEGSEEKEENKVINIEI